MIEMVIFHFSGKKPINVGRRPLAIHRMCKGTWYVCNGSIYTVMDKNTLVMSS